MKVVTSGEQNEQKIEKLGNSALGLGWDPVEYTIEVDARGNDTNLPYDFSDPSNLNLTKREVLGIITNYYSSEMCI